MIPDWENEFALVVDGVGTLTFNKTESTRRFQLVPSECSCVLPVRSTEDDKPQADGKIPHRRWRSGYQVHLVVEPMVTVGGELDCPQGADLVDMVDELGGYINAMIRTGLISGLPNARLTWTPDGGTAPDDSRMFDRLQLLSAPELNFDGALGGPRIAFDLDTPYPYYISATEFPVVLGGTGIQTFTNLGNTDYWPVVKVSGSGVTDFTYYNESVTDLDGDPLYVQYDAALPGGDAIDGSSYIEFDHWKGTAYRNGSGARRLAGVDFRATTFWQLVPGLNEISITDGTATILAHHAWA